MKVYSVWEHHELTELYLKKEKAEEHVRRFTKEWLEENPTVTYIYDQGNPKKSTQKDIPISLEEIEVIE